MVVEKHKLRLDLSQSSFLLIFVVIDYHGHSNTEYLNLYSQRLPFIHETVAKSKHNRFLGALCSSVEE